MASIIFYLGSTYSYVSVKFDIGIKFVCDVLDFLIYVFTLIGEFVVATYVYHSCSMLFVIF